MNAQMSTDNSYLRENYNKSKTAKKAAARKAARKAKKAEKEKAAKKTQAKQAKAATYYVKAKDGSVTTKEKAAEIAENIAQPYLA